MKRWRYRLRALRWALTATPISGAEDDPPKDDPKPDDKPAPDPAPKPDPEPEPEDSITVKRDEFERLRRKVAEQEQAERERKRKADEEAGKWQDIVSAAEKEAAEAKTKAEEAAAELTAYKRNEKVARVAKRLKFRDPDDAHKFLPERAAEGSESKVEEALRAVADAKPYLVDEGPSRSGKPAGGDGDDDTPPDGDLAEQIENSDDPEQIRKLAEKARAG